MPPPDFAAQRQTMVDSQVRPNDVTDLNIQTAMRRVPREVFLRGRQGRQLPISPMPTPRSNMRLAAGLCCGRGTSPRCCRWRSDPRAGERALAIAAPYAAAVLEALRA